MEKLKKYWKEIGLVVLGVILIFSFFKDRVNISTTSKEEIENERVKDALEGFKVYQEYLNTEHKKLDSIRVNLEKIESLNTIKVLEAKEQVSSQKAKYNAKKTTYKNSANTVSLDSLIRVYTKGR